MRNLMRNRPKWGAVFQAVLAAFFAAGSGAALAATLPATTGTLIGTTRTFNLWANAGTITLPNGAGTVTLPVWGYTDAAAGSPTVPGPILIVNQGETITVNLTNNLGESTALLFQGQDMVPDTSGAAANGGTKSYSFLASNPGTYLYEAGLLPNAQHQAAMGMYGALIVRPSPASATRPIPDQAYGDPATSFLDEALVLVSEIDPALNNSVSPATFDMRNYAPKYFLINGKAYPQTDPIPSNAGNTVLLRYVNAGLQQHSMALLGMRQNFVAKGGSLLPLLSHDVVAESLAPGQTADAIAGAPALPAEGGKFALYDGSMMLHNSNAQGFGGMLTFLTTGTALTPGGPATSGVALSPNPTNGSVAVALTATVSDVASGGDNIQAAEYFIDTMGASGTGTAMSGASGSPTVTVSATLSISFLATLASGNHTIYVHGQDALGNWGSFNFAVLNLDKAGPSTASVALVPNPTNGTVDVALSATGDDRATGNSNIVAAEYFIDAAGSPGSGAPMTVNLPAPMASLTATIPAATVAGLSQGSHTVYVHSRDSLGNWGTAATVALTVDKTGPTTGNVSAAPNPNNGALGFNSSVAAVRVTAPFADNLSMVGAAEGFIDAVGTNGTGIIFIAGDGVFDSASEMGYSDIPLASIGALNNGNHTIYVHGKDSAGNWGAMSTTILVIDKAAPTISNVTLTPSTVVFGTAGVTLNVTGTDIGTGVIGGQYWIDGTAAPPANATPFTGTTATISTGALAGGFHTVYVRMQDAAQNWSGVSSATLTVIQAMNDTRTISANTSATQTSDVTAPGVLANDQPLGAAGRTARLVSAPVRTSGAGAGTITLSCPAALGTPAIPGISGNTVCTNGAYRVTLNGVGGNGNARRASKQGTFQFSYGETLNGVTSNATVTITVN